MSDGDWGNERYPRHEKNTCECGAEYTYSSQHSHEQSCKVCWVKKCDNHKKHLASLPVKLPGDEFTDEQFGKIKCIEKDYGCIGCFIHEKQPEHHPMFDDFSTALPELCKRFNCDKVVFKLRN